MKADNTWAWPPMMFDNAVEKVKDYLDVMNAVGTIPEFECFDVGIVRSVNELNFRPKMIGGGMVGLQNTSIKAQLGPLLNGWTNYDFWLPVPKMMFPGVKELMEKYQAKAAAAGVDALGYYMAPQAYAQMQVVEQAVTETKGTDDAKLADYMRKATFKTVVGDVKFGKGGEWSEARVVQVQFQNVKGADVAQFRDMNTQVVVTPEAFASGKVISACLDRRSGTAPPRAARRSIMYLISGASLPGW